MTKGPSRQFCRLYTRMPEAVSPRLPNRKGITMPKKNTTPLQYNTTTRGKPDVKVPTSGGGIKEAHRVIANTVADTKVSNNIPKAKLGGGK